MNSIIKYINTVSIIILISIVCLILKKTASEAACKTSVSRSRNSKEGAPDENYRRGFFSRARTKSGRSKTSYSECLRSSSMASVSASVSVYCGSPSISARQYL